MRLICLLDVCTRGLHALRLVEMTIWRLFGRLSLKEITLLLGCLCYAPMFLRGITFIGNSVLCFDIPLSPGDLRLFAVRGGLATLRVPFPLPLAAGALAKS